MNFMGGVVDYYSCSHIYRRFCLRYSIGIHSGVISMMHWQEQEECERHPRPEY